MNARLRVALTALVVVSQGCARSSVGSLSIDETAAGDPLLATQAESRTLDLPSMPPTSIDSQVQAPSAKPSPLDTFTSTESASRTPASVEKPTGGATQASWTPSPLPTDTLAPTFEPTKLLPTWTPSIVPTHTAEPEETETLATATSIASTTTTAEASVTASAVDPGLVIRGAVRLPGGSGVAGVVICRRLAGYAGVPVAVTDEEGKFTGEFEYVPGDEMITVWPYRGGYVFEPERVYWRHYHGLEITDLQFIAYAFFPTPTHTPSLTTTPRAVTGTPTPSKTPQILGGDCRGG